jgi:hypothetical protein
LERSLNATSIALIRKKVGAVDIKDFRPINLVGGVYKIISKVLANRPKMIFEKVISKTRNAFIRGTQILDSIFIANKCLDSRIKYGEPSVLCKLYLEKAYDYVNWGFLLDMLVFRRNGEWIAHCISIVRFSILINGIPTSFFNSSSGLRQGIFYSFCFMLLLWRL